MTAKKVTLRKRLQAPEDNTTVPADLAAWFKGTGTAPWIALLPGPDFIGRLPALWRTWKRSHPDAVPPKNYEYLERDDAER